jgi:hypothetical protein
VNKPSNTPDAGRAIWSKFRLIYRMSQARADGTAAAPNSMPVHPRNTSITYYSIVLGLFSDLSLPGDRSAWDRDQIRHPGELIFQEDQQRPFPSLG